MFIDRVTVRVSAGTGGSGCTSFRREWREPLGGPDGGEGGRGGDVLIRGDTNLGTLLDYTYRDKWAAERGEHGMGSNKTGRSGESVVLPVPPGTVVKDAESGEILAEILESGQEVVICRGGRGGKGNSFFATATHQTPREWQPGEEGEERTIELELKLIADIGLVGEVEAVNPEPITRGEDAAEDITRHLARHGVRAEAVNRVTDPDTVGESLLHQITDLGADMVVMGAYGRSRWRNFILGSLTGYLLRHMTKPILFSH